MKYRSKFVLFVLFLSATASASDVKHVHGEWYIDFGYYGEEQGDIVKILITDLEDRKYKATVDCERKVVISGGTYSAESGPMWSAILEEVCDSAWKFW